jgi:hypothetical protein
MKNIFIIFMFFTVAFYSCSKDNVVAPSAEYDIQTLDKTKNEYVNLEKPYQLEVNIEYRVISQNSSEYNSFYMGDSLLVGKVWIKQIYSEQPKIDHRGLALKYDLKLKRSTVAIKYSKLGVYPATFVAGASGNDGNDVAFAVNSDNQITVIQ